MTNLFRSNSQQNERLYSSLLMPLLMMLEFDWPRLYDASSPIVRHSGACIKVLALIAE